VRERRKTNVAKKTKREGVRRGGGLRKLDSIAKLTGLKGST